MQVVLVILISVEQILFFHHCRCCLTTYVQWWRSHMTRSRWRSTLKMTTRVQSQIRATCRTWTNSSWIRYRNTVHSALLLWFCSIPQCTDRHTDCSSSDIKCLDACWFWGLLSQWLWCSRLFVWRIKKTYRHGSQQSRVMVCLCFTFVCLLSQTLQLGYNCFLHTSSLCCWGNSNRNFSVLKHKSCKSAVNVRYRQVSVVLMNVTLSWIQSHIQ